MRVITKRNCPLSLYSKLSGIPTRGVGSIWHPQRLLIGIDLPVGVSSYAKGEIDVAFQGPSRKLAPSSMGRTSKTRKFPSRHIYGYGLPILISCSPPDNAGGGVSNARHRKGREASISPARCLPCPINGRLKARITAPGPSVAPLPYPASYVPS